jgi:pimeloyl-ACP methyl ester carboxylesterase
MTRRLSLLREGSGPALVLVHGYFGSGGHWRGQVEAFRDRFDVIAPNLAGFGDSAHLQAPDSIAGHARLVWELLDSLDIDEIRLLGHSMGGMVVQEMTAQQPGRVARLVLYGTGPVGVLPGRFETIETSRQRLAAEGVTATMRRIAATWFVDEAAAPGYAVCEAEGMKATTQAAAASLTSWEGWDGTAALARIRAPTLILWGEHDRSYNRSQPEALLRGIPDARLEVLPGCAHAAHLEQPDLFNRLLGDFLLAGGAQT